MSQEDKEALTKIHNRMLDEAVRQASAGEAELLILDEVTYPVNWGLLDVDKLKDFLKEKPEELELVCTGRDAADFIVDAADYITEMRCIRHPFEKGFPHEREWSSEVGGGPDKKLPYLDLPSVALSVRIPSGRNGPGSRSGLYRTFR